MSSSAQDRKEIHDALDAWLDARAKLAKLKQEYEFARSKLALAEQSIVGAEAVYRRVLGDAP